MDKSQGATAVVLGGIMYNSYLETLEFGAYCGVVIAVGGRYGESAGGSRVPQQCVGSCLDCRAAVVACLLLVDSCALLFTPTDLAVLVIVAIAMPMVRLRLSRILSRGLAVRQLLVASTTIRCLAASRQAVSRCW